MAPFYARSLAGSDGFRSNINGTLPSVGDLVQQNTAGLGLGVTPIGPTGSWAYCFGADLQGRDIAVRLLYGGRTSLLIATSAAILSMVLALPLGVLAGFIGGVFDSFVGWLLDMVWAFPVYLLAISLASVLTSHEIKIGPVNLTSESLLLPISILGIIYFPYVARPLRAEVRSISDKGFILAAAALGGSPIHLLRYHIFPFSIVRVLLFIPILLAFNLLTEATLSVLSLGVQAPQASWGSLLGDGQGLIYVRPVAAIAPGLAVAITAVALNVLSRSVQEAFALQGGRAS